MKWQLYPLCQGQGHVIKPKNVPGDALKWSSTATSHNGMITKLAVRWLTWQLKRDKGFWYSYQANIAMTIYDNYEKYFPLTTGKNSPTLKEWCNICANDFLNLWVS